MKSVLSVMDHAPIRDLRRLTQILQVAAKYGWSRYVEHLRLKGYLSKEPKESIAEELSDAVRLRMALEELGPTFIKFGQMLSVRQDLFSQDVIQELQKLQDKVPSFPAAQAREIVEHELGRSVDELFAGFDDTPLAAASIAQVHGAVLHDGASVIVKVQRPGIEDVIQTDLEILSFIADLLVKHVPESQSYDPVGLVDEFSETIRRELDFRREGRSAERLHDNFKDDARVYIPRIFWEQSGRRALTMERSLGRKIGAEYPEERRKEIADTLTQVFLTQLLEHGFFHGDPHSGNVFVMEDGRLCFHDFGIMGYLSPSDQEHLRQLFMALMVRDAQWMANVYLGMGGGVFGVDREAFVRDLGSSVEEYYTVASRGYSFGEILNQFISLGKRHRLKALREFLLVSKSFMALESVVRLLDPEFDMVAAFRSYLPRMLGKQWLPTLQPVEGLANGYRILAAWRGLATQFPEALNEGLSKLREGELNLRVHYEDLWSVEQHLDRASNRLSFALIIAAIVVGSSIVMSSDAGPHYKGIPFLGLLGYLLAGILGIWWIVAILRSGKL